MPVRATKRGAERSPLSGSADVIVCGASFAGLAVARALAGAGADVLVLDRYEIGERQTSACAAPPAWLEALGLESTILQTFGDLVIHTPSRTLRWDLPWSFSTFDYRRLCAALWDACGAARFETATVTGRSAGDAGDVVVHTDRGDLRAPLVVDALGWRRVLGAGKRPIQPPEATLSRGLEVHPAGSGADFELWLDPRYVRQGYAWSFPAGDEVRVGVGSFEPRDHVRAPTVDLARDLGLPAEGFQGNWIPHRMREPVDAGMGRPNVGSGSSGAAGSSSSAPQAGSQGADPPAQDERPRLPGCSQAGTVPLWGVLLWVCAWRCRRRSLAGK